MMFFPYEENEENNKQSGFDQFTCTDKDINFSGLEICSGVPRELIVRARGERSIGGFHPSPNSFRKYITRSILNDVTFGLIKILGSNKGVDAYILCRCIYYACNSCARSYS